MTLLEKLLAATPMPPETADAEELVAAFDAMFANRETILAAAKPETDDPSLRAELAARDAAWQQALSNARDAIGASRIAAGKARRYVKPDDSNR